MKNIVLSVNSILPVSQLTQLVSQAPDKETLLALELPTHHFLRRSEALALLSEDFARDESGIPVQIRVSGERSHTRQVVVIQTPQHFRPLFQALLPESGPVFLSRDPYARLRKFGGKMGIHLTTDILRRSCIAYTVASGMPLDQLASLCGFSNGWWHHHLSAVSRAAAEAFWHMPFDPDRVAALPRLQRHF
jgi:integrase